MTRIANGKTEVQKAKARLDGDVFFRGMQMKIVDAKPFAIYLQKEEDDDEW